MWEWVFFLFRLASQFLSLSFLFLPNLSGMIYRLSQQLVVKEEKLYFGCNIWTIFFNIPQFFFHGLSVFHHKNVHGIHWGIYIHGARAGNDFGRG